MKKKDLSDDDISISLYSEITSYFSTADLDLGCAENVLGKMWVKFHLGTSFRSTQYHSSRDVRAKLGIPNSSKSPDIRQNSDEGISDFQISGQSLIKRNCHNSRTSDDIDMKLGPVTKTSKKNNAAPKKCEYDAMSKNCDVITIFFKLLPIWSNPEAGFRTHSL